MHWFFDPEIHKESKVVAKEELRHFASLRIRQGDQIACTNGRGLALVFNVIEPKSGQIDFAGEIKVERSPIRIHLVQALAKGDRDELAVQASVELGIDSVTPWQSEHSISNWQGKEHKGRERWQQIAISAVKQSQQAWLPRVNPLTATSQLQPQGKGLILLPQASKSISDFVHGGDEFTLIVGPEGGITDAEISALQAAGFHPARLGPTVLRTSTAGPAAIAALNALSGSW